MTEVSITVDHYLQTVEELKKAKALLLELAMSKKPWVDLTKEECFELCVKHKDNSFSLLVAVQEKLMGKNT
jgi:hypothetical protein